MRRNETIIIDGDLLERLERTESRLNGLAVLLEERSYGLEALGISTEGFDMDADNLIASILREEAKTIDEFFKSIAKEDAAANSASK